MVLGASVLAAYGLAGCSSGAGNGDVRANGLREATIVPTEENVRVVGRTYQEDGAIWLPQSGSALEFLASAARIELELVGDESVNNVPDLCPRFAVLVDGEVLVDDTLNEPSRTIEIPLSKPADGAVVQVMHLSEANRGVVGVRSITVDSSAEDPVVPTDPKDLSIAFVGDSITAAYGAEASSNDEPYTTATQNFMKSYAYLTACALDADYEAVCYSGYGVVSGWSGDGERNEDMLLPPVYELVAAGHEQTWDFEAHPRDVVVVSLGTNDFTYTGTDEAKQQEFSEGYVALLGRIRELNPESLIICTLGTMWGSEALYPALEQAVQEHVDHTGDDCILCYQSDPIDETTDAVVLNGHPDEEGHRKIASKLTEVIRQALG